MVNAIEYNGSSKDCVFVGGLMQGSNLVDLMLACCSGALSSVELA